MGINGFYKRGPKQEPKGFVFLDFALRAYGVNGVGGRWHSVGSSAIDAAMDGRYGDEVHVDPADWSWDATEEAEARLVLQQLGKSLASAFRSGKVQTVYRRKGGGPKQPIEPEWWDTDDPLLRFRTASFDPDDPVSEAADLPCWIFVRSDQLRVLFDEVTAWRLALPRLEDVAPEEWPHFDYFSCRVAGTSCRVNFLKGKFWIAPPSLPDFDIAPQEAPQQMTTPAAANDRQIGSVQMPAGNGGEEDRGVAKPKRQTNKQPGWLAPLRGAMEAKDRRAAELRLQGKPEPIWPKAPFFRRQLIEDYKIPEEKLKQSTVRMWVARINKELGR